MIKAFFKFQKMYNLFGIFTNHFCIFLDLMMPRAKSALSNANINFTAYATSLSNNHIENKKVKMIKNQKLYFM